MYADVSKVLYSCFLMAHSEVLALITSPFSKWLIVAVTYLPEDVRTNLKHEVS